MSIFEFFPGKQFHELLVEVKFKNDLLVAETMQIMNIVSQIIDEKIVEKLNIFLEGVASITINLHSLRIQFRFTAVENSLNINHEEIVHRRAHFIWYLFAKIDTYHPLGDTPFPSDFRSWLDIAEEYGLDDTDQDS